MSESLTSLRERVQGCRECELYKDATQSVFGAGSARPRVLVCLGAVAAQALLGSKIRVTKDRGKPLESDLAAVVLVTIHPSAILRERDEPARDAAFRAFVADLELVASELTRAG